MMDRVLEDIRTERGKQDHKWGHQDHAPIEWLTILMEEVGEASERINTMHWLPPQMIGTAVGMEYRAEMIQVAAVVVAAIEAWDRQHA